MIITLTAEHYYIFLLFYCYFYYYLAVFAILDCVSIRLTMTTRKEITTMTSTDGVTRSRRRRSLLTTFTSSEQFNVQIMKRIQERLDDFMSIPVDSCQQLDDYRLQQGFPSLSLDASDRDAIFKFLYTFRRPNVLLYLGLEDGSIFYYFDNWMTINYREPGNSGYVVDDGTMNEDNPYYKHYTSCVDSETGTASNCTMEEGMYYVDCIDDCDLVPCPIKDINNTDASINTTETWCSNYQVKNVEANQSGTLGYVPTSDYCVNKIGQPEQRPGYVLTDYELQQYGNCYYNDGTTIVNRTLSGSYASCGIDNEQCNTTFTGAYATSPYDPRARPW